MLLVVNAGSSSVKVALFDGLDQVAAHRVAEIGAPGQPADHAGALALSLAAMGVRADALRAAAHRVVHGGAGLTATQAVTPAVEAAIAAAGDLAPLHNPANLTGIHAIRRLAPDLAQYAAFDTAFHATNPDLATTYALPAAERARGLRRYGFHGLSYAAMVRKLLESGDLKGKSRLLAFHLGNGVSACAILNGQSVASSMGYSPLDGLTMGTRSGAIDGMAVLDLAARHGIAAAGRLLNRDSGLLALGGHSDMRALHAAATPEAAFAIDHFCYWAIRHGGSLIAAMGGLDAIAFTGGIGENDPAVRAAILQGLGFLGVSFDPAANAANAAVLHDLGARVAIWTVAAEEERQIALETRRAMTSEGAG